MRPGSMVRSTSGDGLLAAAVALASGPCFDDRRHYLLRACGHRRCAGPSCSAGLRPTGRDAGWWPGSSAIRSRGSGARSSFSRALLAPGRHEHAEAPALFHQPLVDQLLVALEHRQRIEAVLGRHLADGGQRLAFLERALEHHRHHAVAQLAVDRLGVVPLGVDRYSHQLPATLIAVAIEVSKSADYQPTRISVVFSDLRRRSGRQRCAFRSAPWVTISAADADGETNGGDEASQSTARWLEKPGGDEAVALRLLHASTPECVVGFKLPGRVVCGV